MPTRPRASFRLGLLGALPVAAILALAAPTVLAADRSVRIEDFAFSPRTITINVGDRVRWTNRDPVEHTATARNGSFDTGLLADGESYTIRFNAAGRYRYICTPHPTMTGTVVVRAAGGVRPPDTSLASADPGPADGGVDPTLLIAGGLGALVIERRLRRRFETAADRRT